MQLALKALELLQGFPRPWKQHAATDQVHLEGEILGPEDKGGTEQRAYKSQRSLSETRNS